MNDEELSADERREELSRQKRDESAKFRVRALEAHTMLDRGENLEFDDYFAIQGTQASDFFDDVISRGLKHEKNIDTKVLFVAAQLLRLMNQRRTVDFMARQNLTNRIVALETKLNARSVNASSGADVDAPAESAEPLE